MFNRLHRTIYSNIRTSRLQSGIVAARSANAVKSRKLREPVGPHEFFQKARLGFQQIDHQKAVDHVGEVFIDVETENFGVQFQVLSEKNGNSFAVLFDFGDKQGDGIDVLKSHGG